jgi:hypothetical protein
MIRLVIAFAALSIAAVASTIPAQAGCPAGTRYDCTSTYNGKQSCGCR